MKEIRLLIHLLKAALLNIDLEHTVNDDPITKEISLLYLELHNISYYSKRQKVLGANIEHINEKYDFFFRKLRAKYNIKEYLSVLNELCAYIKDGNVFSVELIQLLMATLYCLGRFNMTNNMYSKYYELVNDLEALFFCGMSLYYMDMFEDAKATLNIFIEKVNSNAASRIKYLSLLDQAKECVTK